MITKAKLDSLTPDEYALLVSVYSRKLQSQHYRGVVQHIKWCQPKVVAHQLMSLQSEMSPAGAPVLQGLVSKLNSNARR